MDEELYPSSAVISAVEGGFRLTFDTLFVGERSDEQGRATVEQYREIWEQTRLILQTLSLIGFEVQPGQPLMERTGTSPWRQSAPLPSPSAPPTEAPGEIPAVKAVKELIGNGAKTPAAVEEEPAPDPILRAAIQGKDPFMGKQLAAAITEKTPVKERGSLAKILGQSADQIYGWMMKNPAREFTIGEVAKGTNHSDYVTATRLKDLEGAGLVVKGSKEGTGKHKRWATYRAVAENPPVKGKQRKAAPSAVTVSS